MTIETILPNNALRTMMLNEQSIDNNGAGFDRVLALSYVTTNATQALQTHGAAPDNPVSQIEATNSQSHQGGVNSSDRAAVSPETPHQKVLQKDRFDGPMGSEPATSRTPAPQQTANASTLFVGQNVVASNNAPLPTTSAHQTPRTTAALQADLKQSVLRETVTARKAQTAKPGVIQQDFSAVLAKRIAGDATRFELRLDPPELGRIDGRFELSDDGKNILSLKFDNKSAFDLFRQDEAALRLALSDAGVDAGETDLAFEFVPASEDADRSLSISLVGEPAENHFFRASWSSGVIDVTI